ncbi:MAG: sensor domain-containing diguanylate cyclase [Candidatus Aquicultor sp.]
MLTNIDDNVKQFFSLKERLFILLLVMILPFIAFSIYKALSINDTLEKQAQTESLLLAKNVAHEIDDYITSTGEFLIPIANSKDVRTQNYLATSAWFKKIIPSYPFYRSLTFIDMNGNIRAWAVSDPAEAKNTTMNVRNEDFFKKAVVSNDVSVGDFMHCMLTGKPVIHVTYPVFNYANTRVGFVSTSFDIRKIQGRLIQLNGSKHTVVDVVAKDGTIVARSQESGKYIGRNLSQNAVVKAMTGKTEGVDKVTGPDGITRVYGFASTTKVPWFTRAGVDTRYIQDQVKGQLANHFAVFIPLLLVAIAGWLWIGREVDRLHKKTEYMSLVDPLTDLWNYRKLYSELDHEINRARRQQEKLSFAMIDIDHFKHFNDKNGHQQGDEALRAVAKVIVGAVRDVDFVFRYGGEEMSVILPDTDKAGARVVAERIRKDVEQASIPGAQEQPSGRLTVSIGLATYPYDSISKEGLIKTADSALYRAKSKGRNRVEAYGDDDLSWDDEHYLNSDSYLDDYDVKENDEEKGEDDGEFRPFRMCV